MLLIITIALFFIIVSFIIPISMADGYAEIDEIQETREYLLDENQGVYNNNQDFSTSYSTSIAFVFPTFTMAAYDNSFYKFFNKYGNIIQKYKDTGEREYITSDLDLLTSPQVPLKGEIYFDQKSSGLLYLSYHLYEISPDTSINYLTDKDINYLTDIDIHNGLIFDSNHQNKYNVLVLGHQEYVTQQEYDNFRKFVENGGILILLDANTFYAEVDYDPFNNKITFVKGHELAFDGQKAWPDVRERWADETTEWAGSNFACSSCSITFDNNPFQYTHYEENYITNPNAEILIDYETKSEYNYLIGAYELEYQLGKVISFGIFGDNVVSNNNFLRFFDSILIGNDIIKNPNQPQQIQQP